MTKSVSDETAASISASAQCPYSPLDPKVLADPFPAYAQLRSECPVHNTNMGGREFLTVANRADVHSILTSPNEWVNRYGAGIAYSGVDGRGNLQHLTNQSTPSAAC